MKPIIVFCAVFFGVHLLAAWFWWLSGAPLERGPSLARIGFLTAWGGSVIGMFAAISVRREE